MHIVVMYTSFNKCIVFRIEAGGGYRTRDRAAV